MKMELSKRSLLSKESFKKAGDYIKNHGRELEKARFAYIFENSNVEDIYRELKKYQNSDGGFGHGLESDFRLPDSSPIASTIAFQILDEISNSDNKLALIYEAISYFEDNFDSDRMGWYTVSSEVNNYPHAPWWNFNHDDGMTVIDKSWGNPSAEIIGYLYKYKEYVKMLDLEELIDNTLNYFFEKKEFTSEHEVYCYIRLYKNLPIDKQLTFKNKLENIVHQLVCTNPEEWKNYKPQPVHLADDPDFTFNLNEEDISINLDYLIDKLELKGYIEPNWEWGQYQEVWEEAKREWTGVLTLKTLIILNKYNRIEK